MKTLPNILIVDDDNDNLFFLQSIVSSPEVNLIEASSGSDALKKTHGIELALAILDIRMPEMDGFELALKINGERLDEKVPIIFLTANYYDDLYVNKGYNAGAVDYMIKPFNNHILLSKVKIFIDLFNQKQTIKSNAKQLKGAAVELAAINDTLQVSEARMKDIIFSMSDWVWEVDENGNYTYISNNTSGHMGYTQDEIIGKSFFDFLAPNEVNRFSALFSEIVANKWPIKDLKNWNICKDGKKICLLTNGVPIFDKLGNIKGFRGVNKDITESLIMEDDLSQKQTELIMQNEELVRQKDLLETSGKKYSSLYDFAPTGLVTLSADREIKEINPRAANLLNKNISSLKGSNFGFFVSQKTLPVFNAFFLNIFKSNTKETCEIELETNDKKPIFAHIEGLSNKSGMECHLSIIAITERIQKEKDLLASKKFIDEIINTVPARIFWKDTNLVYQGCNTVFAQDAGFSSPAEIIGKNDFDMGWFDQAELYRTKDKQVIESGVPQLNIEEPQTTPTGKITTLLTSKTPMCNSKGNIIGILGTYIDITLLKKAEEIKQKSISILNETGRMAKVGGWELDVITGKQTWTEETFRIFEIDTTRGEPRVPEGINFFIPESRPIIELAVQNAIQNGEPYNLQLEIITAKGNRRWVHTIGKANQKNGITKSLLGAIQDVTEQKLVESELEEAREKYRGLSEASYVAIFISKKGVCIEQNLAAETMFGYTSKEAIGRYGTDWIVPEDRKMVMNNMISGHGDAYEARALRKNGSSFPCIIQGKMMHYKGLNARVTSLTDISERKNAFDALRKSEEKYKTMMNASPDGILLTDLKGFVTDISEIGTELFGINNSSEIIGKHICRFVPSEEKETVRQILKKTTSEGISQNTELIIRNANQSLVICEISSTLIQGPDGNPFSFMINVRDISRRKKLESKQLHADRMASLGEMAAGIAHEIMQPLNTMSFVLDNVVYEASKVENIKKEYLKKKTDKIFESITRIRSIIDHIRAFSQSRDNYILTNFDVNLSIRNALSMISEQFKHLAVELKLHLKENLPPIVGNSFQFEQVILNLLLNAKDALLEKKKKQQKEFDMFVEISTLQEDGNLIVEIADNGSGIGKSDIEHIMLPFYTTKDTGKGTGLGLSISYRIIKEMGGSIEVMNNSNHGATFKIMLEIQNKVLK